MNKVPLKELCKPGQVGKYGIPASAEDFDVNKVRYLRISDIDDNGNLLQNDKKSVSAVDIEKYVLEEDDLVVARTGNSTGRTYFHEKKNGKLAFAGFLIKFGLDSKKVLPKYLKYFTISREYKQWIKNLSVGSTRGNINAQTFADCPISLPKRKQQELLVNTLSALDAKIELNNRINAELEAMAKTLYEYWFVQFDFPDKNGKPYKSSGGKMVWNEELKREIPDLESWNVRALSNAVNIFDSKRIPLSNMERENRKGKYPYYGATCIMDYIDDYIFDGEYILLAEDGSVMDEKGLPIVQFIWGKTWVNNHAHVLQPKIHSHFEYVFHMLKSISVVQIMTGSIQKKINQENLMNVNVIYPDKDTLNRFSKFATPIRKQLMNIYEENQKLTELRDWLLPMLMNGQVKVMDENELTMSMAAEPKEKYGKSE